MKLTQAIFDVLVYIETKQNLILDRNDLLKSCFLSNDRVNDIISLLQQEQLIYKIESQRYRVTDKGYKLLEPYKVKRAILIAAGFGSRMKPITINTPKPLVRVHGKRLIETLLDALIEKGITEIHIVRGYLGEQFEELKTKYPNIRLYTNDKYTNENNISSAMLVKDLYSNAYVMDADLYLKNKDIIRKYEFSSNYLGVYTESTDDWILVEKDSKVVGMKREGTNCHLMVGLSFWDEENANFFKEDIIKLYNTPSGKNCYWDDVVLGELNSHYNISVRKCHSEDIFEIDSFEELKEIDKIYK